MSEPFGDLSRLLRHLDGRVEAQSSWADVRNLRALARSHSGDDAGARADLEAAVGVNPEYATARFNLAWLLLRSSEPGAAARAIDIARPLPEPLRRHLDVVRASQSGGVDEAVAMLEGGSGPWDVLLHLWLVVGAGRWSEASVHLQRVAARDADFPAILHAAGLLVSGAPDRDRLAAWSNAFAGNPHGAALCWKSAEIAHAGGDIEASRSTLAWGAVLSLDLCGYWTSLGAQHESLGEERASLVALRRAVQVDPESVPAHVALGYLFAARGLAREAIAEMEIASRLAPGWADVHYQLGLLYSDAGRADAAEAELRAALEVQPEYVLARLALGCLLETQGRDPEALQLLQSVRRAGLRSADLESRLAGLHARLGHRNQARRAQLRARASVRTTVPAKEPRRG